MNLAPPVYQFLSAATGGTKGRTARYPCLTRDSNPGPLVQHPASTYFGIFVAPITTLILSEILLLYTCCNCQYMKNYVTYISNRTFCIFRFILRIALIFLEKKIGIKKYKERLLFFLWENRHEYSSLIWLKIRSLFLFSDI